MVKTRSQIFLNNSCKKRCKKVSQVPLKKLDLSDMCVKDIYAFIRVYGSKNKLAMLAHLGSRVKRRDLCKLFNMNI